MLFFTTLFKTFSQNRSIGEVSSIELKEVLWFCLLMIFDVSSISTFLCVVLFNEIVGNFSYLFFSVLENFTTKR